MTAIVDSTATRNDSTDNAARPSSRGPLLLAALLALGWIAFLAILTWVTANPVTLNLLQIRQSDVVLVGKVTGTHTISRTDDRLWPLAGSEITVTNLPEAKPEIGQSYLFALQQRDGSAGSHDGPYQITPTHLPNRAPLIYPATPEALAQLNRIQSQSPSGPVR
jgi:hypothetical protein